MRTAICFLFLFLHQISVSQVHEIRGKIIDSINHFALPFAQVSLRLSGSGTVSNEDGEFRLDSLQVSLNDTLNIFFMGYETKRVAASDLPSPSAVILLKPAVVQLSELDIIGFTPQEIIRRAVERIPANYGRDPLILTAFIRSQKSVNNKLAEYTEAIIENFKEGYNLYKPAESEKKHRQSNIPLLLKGRVISDTNLVNAMGDVGRNVGCLGCNFINDLVEFYHQTILDETLFRYYDLSMEEMILPGEGKIYHIWFAQKKTAKKRLWKGDLYIDAATFAVMKITQKPSMYAYEAYEKSKYQRGYTILNKPGWIEEMPFIQLSVNYSKRDTCWFLSSISIENWMTFTYPENGRKLKFNYKNDVIITNTTRNQEKVKNFKGDKNLGTTQRWDQIIGRPDESFWTHFNYLPIEDALRTAVETIGK
jgi:hypothetical protein